MERFKKCPECNLNYIKENEQYCAICRQNKKRNPANYNPKNGSPIVYKAIKKPDGTYSPIIEKPEKPNNFKLKDMINKTFYFSTHSEFLNKLFGMNYKNYMKCGWNYTSNVLVWMVRFYGKTNDWINRFKDSDTIIEEYVGKLSSFNDISFAFPNEKYRLVVALEDRNKYRCYTIKGFFEFIPEISTEKLHIFKRTDLDI